MALYATIQEIKDNNPNIEKIVNGSDPQITMWGTEAATRINMFCKQNFFFEQQVAKTLRASYYPTIALPKPLSGEISVVENYFGRSPVAVSQRWLETEPYALSLRYSRLNVTYPSTDGFTLTVTGDWGYADSPDALVILAANMLRTQYELHRASTDYHVAADTVNVITSPSATDLASSLVLLNELRGDYNAHVVSLTPHYAAGTDLVTASVATDLASALALAADFKVKYNNHIANGIIHKMLDPYRVTYSLDTQILPQEIKIAFYKILARIAIRDNPDDLRYHNSGFTSESWGDGYSYSLANAELRNLTHPDDVALLWDHINHGRMVS